MTPTLKRLPSRSRSPRDRENGRGAFIMFSCSRSARLYAVVSGRSSAAMAGRELYPTRSCHLHPSVEAGLSDAGPDLHEITSSLLLTRRTRRARLRIWLAGREFGPGLDVGLRFHLIPPFIGERDNASLENATTRGTWAHRPELRFHGRAARRRTLSRVRCARGRRRRRTTRRHGDNCRAVALGPSLWHRNQIFGQPGTLRIRSRAVHTGAVMIRP